MNQKILAIKVSGNSENLKNFLDVLGKLGSTYEILRTSKLLPNIGEEGYHLFIEVLPVANISEMLQ